MCPIQESNIRIFFLCKYCIITFYTFYYAGSYICNSIMQILLCRFCSIYKFHCTWPSHYDYTIYNNCIIVLTLVAIVMLLAVVTFVVIVTLLAVVMLVAIVTLIAVITLVINVMLVECCCANDFKQMASCRLHCKIVSCKWSHANLLDVNFIIGIGT